MATIVRQSLHGSMRALSLPFAGTPEKPPLFFKLRSSQAFIQVAISFVIFTDIYQYG